jgi:hypothetical protein
MSVIDNIIKSDFIVVIRFIFEIIGVWSSTIFIKNEVNKHKNQYALIISVIIVLIQFIIPVILIIGCFSWWILFSLKFFIAIFFSVVFIAYDIYTIVKFFPLFTDVMKMPKPKP